MGGKVREERVRRGGREPGIEPRGHCNARAQNQDGHSDTQQTNGRFRAVPRLQRRQHGRNHVGLAVRAPRGSPANPGSRARCSIHVRDPLGELVGRVNDNRRQKLAAVAFLGGADGDLCKHRVVLNHGKGERQSRPCRCRLATESLQGKQ